MVAAIQLAQPPTPIIGQVLFYCHFPDLLLAKRRSALHRAYRAPLDAIEEYTTGRADCVAVNSRFTQGMSTQEGCAVIKVVVVIGWSRYTA